MASEATQSLLDELDDFNNRGAALSAADEGNGDDKSPESDIQQHVVNPRRKAKPVASRCTCSGCAYAWSVLWLLICAIGQICYLPFRPFVWLCKILLALKRKGLPSEVCGHRSRVLCPRIRDGQPEPLHTGDLVAQLIWALLLVAGIIGACCAIFMFTDPERYIYVIGRGIKNWTVGWFVTVSSETVSAAAGFPFLTSIFCSPFVGIVLGIAGRDHWSAGFFHAVSGIGNSLIGMRTWWAGQLKDAVVYVCFVLITVGFAVGTRFREVATFMFCCYAVRPKPATRQVHFAEEATLSSTAKTHMARTFMAATAGAYARKFADKMDGGAQYSYDPTMGHADPSYRMRQEWGPNEYDPTMGHSVSSHLKR